MSEGNTPIPPAPPDDPNTGDMPDAPPREGAYAVFRNRSFTLLTIGSLLALIGAQAQAVTIGWAMYNRTGNPMDLGWVGLVQFAPMMLLTIPSGYLADLIDRRLILSLSMIGSVISSLGLAAVAWTDAPAHWMLLVLAVNASARSIGWPARQALVAQVVPRYQLARAMTWRSSTAQVGITIGPAFGGFLIAYLGEESAYLFAAGTAMLLICAMPFIRLQPVERVVQRMSWRGVLDGLRFVFRAKLLLTVIALDLFAVLLGGAEYLLPIFAKDIIQLHGVGLEYLGATTDSVESMEKVALGWLRAAPGMGAFCMAIALAHMPVLKNAGRTMLLAVAVFGLAMIVFGLSTSFWLSMAMLFLTGVVDNVSVVVRHTLMQLLTPDAMRGRVSAVNSVFISSSNELGGFESGLVAKWVGAVWSTVLGGIGTIAVVSTMAWRVPSLRKLGSLDDVKEEKL